MVWPGNLRCSLLLCVLELLARVGGVNTCAAFFVCFARFTLHKKKLQHKEELVPAYSWEELLEVAL